LWNIGGIKKYPFSWCLSRSTSVNLTIRGRSVVRLHCIHR
jgi:hypothetical protein